MTLEQLKPHAKDLGGGFTVRRLLPAAGRQAVGPFLFFDHFGPLQVQPGDHHDVRPHPHIGLATVTYLFDGAMQHHDSTGAFQRIEPGAINWMTAGRGIVHSERRPVDLQGRAYGLHGLQLWVALPADQEEADAAFQHVGADRMPQALLGAARVRVLVGAAYGLQSPVVPASPTLFVDITLPAGAAVDLPDPAVAAELAVYLVDGEALLLMPDEHPLLAQHLAVRPETAGVQLRAGGGGAHVVLVGGAPLGHRHLWWNFVSSRPARIEQAAADWEADALGQVAGETERIPLPAARWRAPRTS
jgi:redox-sensitive bicupin YhaK (pirin superfamily)